MEIKARGATGGTSARSGGMGCEGGMGGGYEPVELVGDSVGDDPDGC